MATCKALTKAGTPCPNRAGIDGLCFSHTPRLAETRDEARKEGGRNRRNTVRTMKRVPDDIKSTLAALFRTLQGLEDGSVDAQTANAVANVSRAIVSAWEAGSVETKLADLEARIEEAARGGA